MHRYPTRRYDEGLHLDADFEDMEAASSPGHEQRSSSPAIWDASSEADGLPFASLPEYPEDVSDDEEYIEPGSERARRAGMSPEEKARLMLETLAEIPHFSLSTFLRTLFMSNSGDITKYTNRFLSEDSHISLMSVWLKENPSKKQVSKDARLSMQSWIITEAASICAKEASFLTDKASDGPFKSEAMHLRVPAHAVTVEIVKGFRIGGLLKMYERTLPSLQCILKAVINKDEKELNEKSRDPDHVSNPIIRQLAFG
ncbi:hypothetical protein D9611_014741 [Ephemerocybe angulata]|uniref:Uncharacterized protein n=1 Tax=Ephemerocybe angulata TaxID=980116 RepID=A0A8H5B7X0_9AGAR|nr:hypothetical protein D9611_014741 [Tulosesus angulatus]